MPDSEPSVAICGDCGKTVNKDFVRLNDLIYHSAWWDRKQARTHHITPPPKSAT
jgi:hypothetical protein